MELRDDQNRLVEDPWRRTELWNADCTRLTLWIHPGRVKEGVNLREELGPVLEEGKRYTLVVSKNLRATDNRPLEKEFTKAFKVGKAIREPLDARTWKIQAPTLENPVLLLQFPQPLDRHLLERCLTIETATGKKLAGHFVLGKDERDIRFTPTAAWETGKYLVRIAGELEDLAGNTPLRKFDMKLTELPPKNPCLNLPFVVK